MFNNEYYLGDDLKSREEKLSAAALHAVVATIGGAMHQCDHAVDNLGVDATCVFSGSFTDDPFEDTLITIYVQLKATRNPKEVNKNGVDCWALSLDVKQIRRYLDCGKHFFLALFIAPPEDEQERWVEVTPESVVVRKSLYWTFLKGFQIDDAQKTNTIYIPKTNLLTPAALVDVVASAKTGKGRYNV